MLAPALFKARAFSAGLVTQLAFWSGQASFFLVLALYLQQGRGMTALQAALLFTVLAVAYVVASARAPGLVARHGRQVIAAGALALAAGRAMLLATALLIVPLTTTILSGVHPDDAGAASGALATMQNVGAALGVAITGAIFFGAMHAGYAHALELSLGELAALLLAVAALSRLLSRGTCSA